MNDYQSDENLKFIDERYKLLIEQLRFQLTLIWNNIYTLYIVNGVLFSSSIVVLGWRLSSESSIAKSLYLRILICIIGLFFTILLNANIFSSLEYRRHFITQINEINDHVNISIYNLQDDSNIKKMWEMNYERMIKISAIVWICIWIIFLIMQFSF